MPPLILALAWFVAGTVIGAFLQSRFWRWRLDDPAVAHEILKKCYRLTHPHWCQVSKDDPTRVCPCCGWSETEGLVTRRDEYVSRD